MVGKLFTVVTVGLGAALACSVTAPAWSSDCDTSYGDDDPLGVLSNFEDCVFHDQSSPVDDGLKPLDHLEQLSPGKWKSFARYNFQSDSYTYAKSGIDGVLDVTGNRRGGTFSFTDLGKLAPYSEFAVSLIRNRDNNQDLTDNDYVFYTFDIEDWENAGQPGNWSTAQFGRNNNNKFRRATDLKIFVKRTPHDPGPKSVPEPMSVLGLVMSGGIATVLKRKLKGNN
jgi:hypothetical protein